MINENTLTRLREFRLTAFIDALIEQERSPETYGDLSFDERLTLLVDAESTKRNNQRVNRLLKRARVPTNLSLSDVDFSSARGITKSQLLSLVQGDWLDSGNHLIITGKTGVGKTFISGIIAQELCRRSKAVRYGRTHQWLIDFDIALQKHRLGQTIAGLRKVPLLILDEWMRDQITVEESRILLDLVDDRYTKHSLMFVSQFPVKDWHDRFDDPTMADAILDRIVHSAHRVELTGDSMRKRQGTDGGSVASLR